MKRKKRKKERFSSANHHKNALLNTGDGGQIKRKKRLSKKQKRMRIIVGFIVFLLMISAGAFVKNILNERQLERERLQTGEIIHQRADKKNVDAEGNQIVDNATADIHIINVGQGAAVLVKNGDNEALIDGGSGSATTTYLKSVVNDGELEYVVSTNTSPEFIGGLPEVYSNFKVKKTIYGKKDKSDGFKAFKKVAKKAEQANNQTIDLGNGISIDVIKPKYGDSAICVVSLGDKRIVLGGNATKKDMQRLKGKYQTVAAYLVEGSGTLTPPENVIATWKPQYAIISSSAPKDNANTSPSRGCMDLLYKHCGQTFATYKSGTIKLTLSTQSLDISVKDDSGITPDSYAN